MNSSTTSTSTMPTSTKPPFVSYSSFFASGLLAANTPLHMRRGTVSSKNSEGSYSDFSNDSDAYYASRSDDEPSTRSSPNRDMDVDDIPTPDAQNINLAAAQRRSATPTPLTLQMKAETEDITPVQSPQPPSATIKATPVSPASAAPPRLRRRKSSLTMAASPISAIRSSTRTAKHQQECMQKAAPAVHARARSGSLGGDVSYNAGVPSPVSPGASLVYGVNALSMRSAATEATSMLGRMRSGSCSNAVVVPPTVARPRRIPRRVLNAAFPAPPAPPPNAPLPALPLPSTPTPRQQIRSDSAPAAHGILSSPSVIHVKGPSASSVSRTSARARGLSVSSSTLSGEENWINEEH
ncbi:hypothetical protein D9619_006840 [Psilocybe cf. subviscida]|uniref:Uncharacterized protein n=1 Tax=Psilocybe cf. subviscida TaxID=2480587 RepID=A0A8H5B560_9AGAR|nr:hypothetical protein D9619_006840 [Psilocybe cf. subviscida]